MCTHRCSARHHISHYDIDILVIMTLSYRYVHSPMFRSARLMNDIFKINKKPEVHTFAENQPLPQHADGGVRGGAPSQSQPFFDPYERPRTRATVQQRSGKGDVTEKITAIGNNSATVIALSAVVIALYSEVTEKFTAIATTQQLSLSFFNPPCHPHTALCSLLSAHISKS